jgi:hypothetical protein
MPSLGYEPYDARLCRVGQSPVTALASTDWRYEVVYGFLDLPRLALFRTVRFTNRFTTPVLDLRLSVVPTGKAAEGTGGKT